MSHLPILSQGLQLKPETERFTLTRCLGIEFAAASSMLQLRPFQQKALSALESPPERSHVICVAPTGAGKSLIYEKAASVPRRKTLLITPLIALARQQFQKLQGIGISARLTAGGNHQTPRKDEPGIWILSPENLLLSQRQTLIRLWNPGLLVVDECHCLWEWGENFRPAFLAIPKLLKLPTLNRSLWLTATLPFQARIQLRNWLPHPLTELGEFDLPPKLNLRVERVPLEKRVIYLTRWLQTRKERGIVFAVTRSSCEKLARLWSAMGRKVIYYHGGMSSEERQNAEALISKGSVEIIVATSAFGMGMHYSQIHFVVLWQPCTSLLSMVQKMGRAARNHENTSLALILWDYEDFRTLEWAVGRSEQRRTDLVTVLRFLEQENECRSVGLRKYFHPESYAPVACARCDVCQKKAGLPKNPTTSELEGKVPH